MAKSKKSKTALIESEEVALNKALAEIEANEGEIADTAVLEDALAEVEIVEGKHAAYEAQPSEVSAEPAAVEPAPKAKKAAKPKAPKEPRVRMSAGAKASDVIRSYFDEAQLTTLLSNAATTVSPEDVSDTLAKIDTLDKKSREKATNLFGALKAGRQPSVYLMKTISALRKAGPLTVKGLTDYFMAECGYKIGTARRQASEMFALLPVVRVAVRDEARGSPMSLDDTSEIVRAIDATKTATA